jgi:hypothetical protein
MTINSTRHSSRGISTTLNSTFANKYKLAADLFCLNVGSSGNTGTRYNSRIGENVQAAVYKYGGQNEPVELPQSTKYDAYNPL